MKTWKKVLLAVAAVPVAVLAFATWYAAHYSMAEAKPFEVNSPSAREHVLIATQGSAFKDAVVQGVVDRLKTRPVYVKVIDVAQLPSVRESDWNAIVILHTWQMSKPPDTVRAFVDRSDSRDKLVVLATSGEGTAHIAGLDTITAASKKADVSARVDEIVLRVEKLLSRQTPQAASGDRASRSGFRYRKARASHGHRPRAGNQTAHR